MLKQEKKISKHTARKLGFTRKRKLHNKQIIRNFHRKGKESSFSAFRRGEFFFQLGNVPNKEKAIRKLFKDFSFVLNYLVRNLKV